MIKYAPRLPPASPKAENKPLRGQRPGPSSTTRHAHPVCLPRWITDKDPSLSRVTDLGIFFSFPFSLYHRALPADIPASPIVLHSALLRLPSSRRCTRPKVPPRWGKSTSSLLPRVCARVCVRATHCNVGLPGRKKRWSQNLKPAGSAARARGRFQRRHYHYHPIGSNFQCAGSHA